MIDGRAKRVLFYTAALLIAPIPVMPTVRGTREYLFAGMACGAILTLASFYVARGELKLKHRGLLGNKLLATSSITLLFGAGICVVSIVYLIRG